MTNPLKCSTEKGQAYTSLPGARACSVCVATHFMHATKGCVAKPRGVDKSEGSEGSTVETLDVNEAFFRFSTTSAEIEACPLSANCLGGVNASACAEGSFGPLCALCEPSYHVSVKSEACVVCESSNVWVGPLVLFGLLALAALVAAVLSSRVAVAYRAHKQQVDEAIEKLVALFVTMQILVILQSNHKGEDSVFAKII